MADPNLIATLIPTDDREFAKRSFQLPHNAARYRRRRPASMTGWPASLSQQATPLGSWAEADRHAFTHRLQLTFDQEPRDFASGYSFGSDAKRCDVLLGQEGTRGISGLHFCVTYNEQMRLVLKASSTQGTAVSYSGQASAQPRRQFVWVLDLIKTDGKWEIKVHLPRERDLVFRIELATRELCQLQFQQNVHHYIQKVRAALPFFDVLDINSNLTTVPPSEPHSPRSRPIYVADKYIGSGSFGTVALVYNVSTGHPYACKQFRKPAEKLRPGETREQQLVEWSENARREVRIMREYPHENIVEVVDFWEHPEPSLFMPYFDLGNLAVQFEEQAIGLKDTDSIVFQALSALAYLHPHGVAHRDIKPANILVASINPLTIKLADFGLANDKSDLVTWAGTPLYTAPEVYNGHLASYTASVDIWSVGVIALEYTDHLPERGCVKDGPASTLSRWREWALPWCERVMYRANFWSLREPRGLIALVIKAMLKMGADERCTASQCLKMGHDMGIFDQPVHGRTTPTRGTFIQSGSGHGEYTVVRATPTQRTFLQNEIDHGDFASGRASGRATPTQRTVFQSGIGKVNSPCSPVVGGLSATDNTAAHENGRTGSSSLQDLSASLWPSNSQLPGVPVFSGSASVGSHSEHSSVTNQVPAGGSVDTEWQQSSGGSSGFNSGRREEREVDTQAMRDMKLRTYALTDWPRKTEGGLEHLRTLHKLVVAVLLDLRIPHDASQVADLSCSTQVGDLREGLARRGIKAITLEQVGPGTAIKAFSNSRVIYLNALTSSERVCSFDYLAWHLSCGLGQENLMSRISV